MTDTKVPLKFKNQQAAIRSASNIYTGPYVVIREYVSNAIDAGAGVVEITIDPANKRIYIQDDGTGMTREKLMRVPQELGETEKTVADIGEMAIGMLSFNGIGGSLDLITKVPENGHYCKLNIQKGGNHARICDITEQEISRQYGGTAFKNGTRICIQNVTPKAIEALQPAKLRRELAKAYDPMFRHGKVVMTVTSTDKAGQTKENYVESIVYPGPRILEEILQLQDGTGKQRMFTTRQGQKFPAELDMCIHLNPAGTNETIGVYHKGVRVACLNELLSDEVYCSGKLTGTINENFLSQNQSKTSYSNDDRMEVFIDELKLYKPVLKERMSEAMEEIKVQEENNLSKEFDKVLAKAYDQLPSIVPKPVPPVVVPPVGRTKKTDGKKHKPKSPYPINFTPFDIAEQQSRVKFDPVYRHVVINNAHPDYVRFVIKGQDNREKKLYVASQIAKGAAIGDYLRNYNKEEQIKKPVLEVPKQISFSDAQLILERESQIFGVMSKMIGVVKKLRGGKADEN
jgi:hypothetical protein